MDLDVVTDRYARASNLFAAALETAVTSGQMHLQAEGERLLEARLTREQQVMAGWSPTGR
jgi:capsid protein